jgi:hypothetical protein
VLLSLLLSGFIDIAIWRHNGNTLTHLNGSTLRVFRNLGYDGYVNRSAHDSWGPMARALELLEGPEYGNLYEKVFFEQQTKFQYPPTSLVYYGLLDRLGLTQYASLNNINGILLVFNAALVFWIFKRSWDGWSRSQENKLSRTQMALLAVTFFVFYPTLWAYQIGQLQIWIDLLFTAACAFWLSGRPAWAGIMIGLAATLKPQLAAFALWAIFWGQWPFLIGLTGVAAAIGLVSLAMFGLHNHLAYLDVLSFISRHGEAYYPNQSINGLLNRLLFNGQSLEFDKNAFAPYNGIVAILTFAGVIAFLAIGCRSARKERAPDIFDFGTLAICVTVSSPIAWEHHYGVMLPLLAVALARLCVDPAYMQRRYVMSFLIASWVLLANDFAFLTIFDGSALNILQSYQLAGGPPSVTDVSRFSRSGFDSRSSGRPIK